MDLAPILALARRQANVCSVRQCTTLGMATSSVSVLVARGLLDRPRRGVLTLPGADLDDFRTRCWIELCAVGSPAWIGGVAALSLHGLARAPGEIDVVVPQERKPAGPGRGRLRRLRVVPQDCTLADGVPALAVVRALFEAATEAPYDEVLGAAAAGVQCGALDLDELVAAAARIRTGARTVRSVATDLAGSGAHSLLAHRVTQLLRGAGFQVEAEVRVRRADGVSAVLDLVVVGTGVAIEVDGHAVHRGRRRLSRDRKRQNQAQLTDWLVLRVDWLRLETDAGGFLAEVRAAVAATGR